ncbi:hypothetical protein BGZ46_004610 [Entomortierella lignicola]|nr:hypothetical protein BGZ46_004610 [Entomortierella lignicola]
MDAKVTWLERMTYDSWKSFNGLVKKNRRTLTSLKLRDMDLPASKPYDGSPSSSPLLVIAQYPYSTLRSLYLRNCELPYRHLKAFWDICERLEVLELFEVPFELPRLHPRQRAPKKTGKPNLGATHQQRVVNFSNLLELSLIRSGPRSMLTQLEEIIRQEKYHRTPLPKAKHLCVPLPICTTPCWPDLESLRIIQEDLSFGFEDYMTIIEMSKRIRFLEVPIDSIFPTVVESLLRLHGHTLTMVDWRNNSDDQDPNLVHQFLSSCPRLTKAFFQPMHGQDLARGGDSWVCCEQLEELGVYISMDPETCNPPNPDMTDEEKRDMSWAVFKQLGRLRNLRILDMKHHTRHSVPLEFTTRMGLQQLSSLRELEVIRLIDDQDMSPEDINWIIKNLVSLRMIDGGPLAKNRARFVTRYNFWDFALATMLNRHGIKTPESISSEIPEEYVEELNWDCLESKLESMMRELTKEDSPLDQLDIGLFR